MIVISPVKIQDSTLQSSTIPEPDTDRGEVEWVSGTYNEGDQVIKSSTHRLYQAAATTTDDPETGVNRTVPTWIIIGASNRYQMFDSDFSGSSFADTPLVIEVDAQSLVNGVAAFGVNGADTINITVTDPFDGVVYDYDLEMQDYTNVTNWYNYFYVPLSFIDEFVLLDLPPYANAVAKITFTGASEISVSALVLGAQVDLGVANYGSSVKLVDYSRRIPDGFGGFKIVKRRTSKLVNFDLTIERNKVNYVFNQLQKLSQVAAVWVGSDGDADDPTLVYGYYKDYVNNIATPSVTDATATIEGLV